MRTWSSPKQNLAPRFVDSKAAQMMFSHHHSQQSSIASSATPRPPPKSQHYQPEKTRWEDDKTPGILVQRDWDVERGHSAETDERPLKGEADGPGRAW